MEKRVCSTFTAWSLKLGGVCYASWCWKPTPELRCKVTSLVRVRFVVVGGRAGVACSIKWTFAGKHAHRQRDRQTQAHSLFLLPLSCLLFCSFLCHTAVLLFSLCDETQGGTLCLSAFNICLTLAHSPNTLYRFLCWLFPHCLSLSLFLSPVFNLCFFNLSCIPFTSLFSSLTLSLCYSIFYVCYSMFFSLVHFTQNTAWVCPFLPLAPNLWWWPVQKYFLEAFC